MHEESCIFDFTSGVESPSGLKRFDHLVKFKCPILDNMPTYGIVVGNCHCPD